MRVVVSLAAVALAGCASAPMSPQQIAGLSDWDVCRLSMGGKESPVAQAEADRRGVDCRPLYGAILEQQRMGAGPALTTAEKLQALGRAMGGGGGGGGAAAYNPWAMPPPPINCRTVRVSPTIARTECN